jgi:hypothetical protein
MGQAGGDVDSELREESIDKDRQRGFADPAQGERGQRDSELRSRDVAVQVGHRGLRATCAAISSRRHL